MWSKYYLACPVARYPACVYLPLSRRNNLGRTTDSEEPGVRSEQRRLTDVTGQSPGGLISFSWRRACPQQ